MMPVVIKHKHGAPAWLLTALLLLAPAPQPMAAGPAPARAVVTAHPLATQAGIDILAQGGNAFDAAVAVTAALAVVEPAASGLGGGGFWLLHRAGDGKQVMVDGRERAPAGAHRQMYLDGEGRVRPGASINGPLAAGIPGTPDALVYLSEHYGRLSLKQALAPAIRFAREGFAVSDGYRRSAARRLEQLRASPAAAAIFLDDGAIPAQGFVLHQPDLAGLLERMTVHGRFAFYGGDTARKLVQGVQAAGGVWTQADLEDYFVVEREPVVTEYRGARVVSASPPSSGGIVLGQALKILEHFDLQTMTGTERKHHVIEAMRRAYRDRAVFLGDPDQVEIPVRRLFDEDYLAGLALTIEPDRATPSEELGDTPQLQQSGESTTHFSVLDTDGNRVAATLSINLSFGSGFVPPETGVLLNNEMDDFAIKPQHPNSYGLVGYEANAVAPGKRPLSSMSPTFVETENRIGLLGTPGGSRIISMVLLGVLDFVAGYGPGNWVGNPRYHHQYLPDVVQYEQYGLTYHEQQGLRERGHRLREVGRRYGDMQAILWDKAANEVTAAADPRGEGTAAVVPADARE